MSASHVAVVIGGTKGIGYAVAKRFIEDEIRVAIISRNAENVTRAVTELQKRTDSEVLGFPCDVTDEKGLRKSFKVIQEYFDPVSVLVNSAGVNKDGLLLKAKQKDMQSVIQTNLVGSMISCQVALRGMLSERRGCIINIGSIVGNHGNTGQAVYSASKSGLIGFTKSLAKEVASRGIRVNLIVPGFIETEMTKSKIDLQPQFKNSIPLQRFGTPDEVAKLARFLVQSDYITGQEIYVDGGLNLSM